MPERTLADGTVVVPVTPQTVKEQAQKLLNAGCQSVCVFFINSYANDTNERIAAETVRAVWPSAYRQRRSRNDSTNADRLWHGDPLADGRD